MLPSRINRIGVLRAVINTGCAHRHRQTTHHISQADPPTRDHPPPLSHGCGRPQRFRRGARSGRGATALTHYQRAAASRLRERRGSRMRLRSGNKAPQERKQTRRGLAQPVVVDLAAPVEAPRTGQSGSCRNGNRSISFERGGQFVLHARRAESTMGPRARNTRQHPANRPQLDSIVLQRCLWRVCPRGAAVYTAEHDS